ncbi:Transmembrane protein, partial [Phytophthora palmivora]
SGSSEHVQVPQGELQEIQKELDQPKKLLGELPATSISGNDILSSVLYSASSVAAKSGKLMPIPLLMVSTVLYFFRFIYEEVVTVGIKLPLHLGDELAQTAFPIRLGAQTESRYASTCTGVVSATSGVHYLNIQVHGDNMDTGYPEVDFAGSMLDGNVFTAIFFGFGASMLGITGFESSSNYVEEQAPGVFRKTLRNMWALVTFFNVGLSTGILAVLPMDGEEGIHANSDALLAKVGRESVGSWFEAWICVDAFVVLCGAVLTSYVGICGLFLSLQMCLVLILNADDSTVEGVYTYSFLGLMAMFSFYLVQHFSIMCCVLMYFAIYFIVVISAMFIMFERVTILRCILVMLKKMAPSRYGKAAAVGLTPNGSSEVEHTGARGGRTIARTIVSIRNAPIVFFCKVPDLTIINKAIIYVRRGNQAQDLRT